MCENLKWIQADAWRKWVHNIAWEMLYKTGNFGDDYLDSLVHPGFKIDELGLVIYARMYHIVLVYYGLIFGQHEQMTA